MQLRYTRYFAFCLGTACAVLTTPPAAADTIAVSNGAVTQNSLGDHNQPKRNGKYTLKAKAFDSLAGAEVPKSRGPEDYKGRADDPRIDTSGQATTSGQRYKPEAEATIEEKGPGVWSSKKSYARVAAGPNTDYKGQETYEARADVTDPWNFDMVDFDFSFITEVTFQADLVIQAAASPGETANASVYADASTDLNNLGTLWSLKWSTTSTDPGNYSLAFSSNPALGLDDAAVTQALINSITSDLSTGASMFTKPYTFSYSLLIPAGTQPTFNSSAVYAVDGGGGEMVPEPGTTLLLLVGLGLIAVRYVRRNAKEGAGYPHVV